MTKLRPFFIAVIAGTFPALASACTVCDSETGQQIRAGIFGEDFWTTLLAVASPFPVLLLGIAAYHYGIPNFWSRSKTEHQPSLASDAQQNITSHQ